jgi:hypothetical protein
VVAEVLVAHRVKRQPPAVVVEVRIREILQQQIMAKLTQVVVEEEAQTVVAL